jgi:large subunit ribosomal protein L35Ae
LNLTKLWLLGIFKRHCLRISLKRVKVNYVAVIFNSKRVLKMGVSFMSQPIYARIVNYRVGPRTQSSKEILIQVIGSESVVQGQLVGKKVVWSNQTSKLVGQISGLHGKNGMLRAKFKNGVPGQAIGTVVEVISS